MRTPCPSHRESGFTLIELLVGLVVLSLAAGLLVSSLNITWLTRPERAAADSDQSVVAAQRILRMRLERLAAVVRLDSAEAVVDAQGDANLLNFAAAPLDRMGPDAIQRFRLMLAPSGELVLFTASSLNDRIDLKDRSLVGWQPTRLLSGANRLELAYYGPDRFSTADRWQSTWIDRPQPPALIRIRLSFAKGDPRQWPDLIVRPRSTVNAACRINRASARCEAI